MVLVLLTVQYDLFILITNAYYSSDRHGKMANRSPLKATENLPKPEEGKQDKQPENPYGPEYPKGENL